ncbi:MAG: 3'-5' exonuclease domain-containing protein 2 [Candidatus Aminicenantes bacterium]|nr:3'-5' exonuclease domain-containing protein 2 [Candidatus Aminicenantes bacterium]
MRYIRANRLDSDYINSLPVIKFEGKVVVVDSKEQEESVIKRLYNEMLIGFDTESRPAFKKGESYPISLLQLATHDTAYLFQLKKTGFTDVLADFLADEKIKKVGVGIDNDIAKLQEQKKFKAGGFIDLSAMAAKKGIIQVGVRALTARYIAHRLVKSSQKTNWAQFGLTRKQQVYAASDAWICLLIYPHLLVDNIDYRQFNDEENNRPINEN